jgi:hypothetical protein
MEQLDCGGLPAGIRGQSPNQVFTYVESNSGSDPEFEFEDYQRGGGALLMVMRPLLTET